MGKGIIAKIKSVKHIEVILAVVAVVVMLIIYVSTLAGGKEKKTNAVDKPNDYCAAMQADLTDVIASVHGAGKTKVLINWESGVEAVIAYVTSVNGNSSTSAPQLITEGGVTKPIVLKEIYPKALGVLIICEGGDNVAVKIEILNAVCVLLDITPDKIQVLKMKK